ncbi:MAG: tetratricopeptide repeat protein [Candidatus Latescibacteria bacterium]|nr:tetratricopeptide repeat protein [Candidatus Latescibacterota bacterium]
MALQNIRGESLRRVVFWGLQALIVLVPLVFSSAFNEYGTPKMVVVQVIAVALAMCWLASMVLDGEVFVIDTPLSYAFMAFLAVQFVSLFLAYNVFEGLSTLFGYLSFFLIASLIFYGVKKIEKMHRLCILMVWTGSIVAVIGLLQHNGVYHFGAPWNLPISTIGNVNFTAQYYNVVFPIALVLLFMPHRFWIQMAIGTSAFLMACHLVVLGSRGGWLGAVVALATLGFAMLFRHYQVGRRLLDSAVMGVVILGLGWPVLTGMMSGIQVGDGRNLGHLFDTHQTRVVERVEKAIYLEDDSTLQRVRLWEDTLRLIWDKPLLGVGMGNFAFNVPKYMSRESLLVKQRREAQTGQDLMAFSAHNEYLEIWAETGILGMGVLFALLYLLLKAVYHWVRRYIRGEEPILVVGLVAAVLATLTHSFFSTNLQQPVSAMHFWIVVGMVWSLKLNVEGRNTVALLETNAHKFAQGLLVLSGAVLVIVAVMGVRTLWGEYYYQRGSLYFKHKAYQDAEHLWERSTQFEPTKYFQTFQALGTARYNLKDWPGAISAFETSLRYFPNNAQVHYLLGRSLVEAGQFDAALPHSQAAVKLNPFVAAYRVGLGEVWYKAGDINNAIAVLQEALRLDANQSEAHQLLGASFTQAGDFVAAVASYQQALVLDATNHEVSNSLAVVYSNQGNFEAAQDIFLQLVQEFPQNLDYRLNLGVVQKELGHSALAVETLQSLLELAPNYIRAYFVLGKVYEAQGRGEDAGRIYETAMKMWPNEVLFQNALKELKQN